VTGRVVCLTMAWLGWIGAVGYGQEPAQPKPVEWLELFNGKDLTGWVAEGKVEFKDKDTGQALPNWSVRDGVIRCEGHGFGFLRYAKQKFADFELQLEYRMLPRGKSMGNSGIGIRVVPYDPKRDEQTRPSLSAYEVQLLDDAGRQPKQVLQRCAIPLRRAQAHRRQACAGVEPGDDPLRRPRESTIAFNGTEVLSVDQSTIDEIRDKPLEGYICLQCHDTPIEFPSSEGATVEGVKRDEPDRPARPGPSPTRPTPSPTRPTPSPTHPPTAPRQKHPPRRTEPDQRPRPAA
jgi:hypothetical protein